MTLKILYVARAIALVAFMAASYWAAMYHHRDASMWVSIVNAIPFIASGVIQLIIKGMTEAK
jgi:hypothetical protein